MNDEIDVAHAPTAPRSGTFPETDQRTSQAGASLGYWQTIEQDLPKMPSLHRCILRQFDEQPARSAIATAAAMEMIRARGFTAPLVLPRLGTSSGSHIDFARS